MKVLKLKTYRPGELYELQLKKSEIKYAKGSDFGANSCEFELKCWDCSKKFLISVSFSNLHCTLWQCPHCGTYNEVE